VQKCGIKISLGTRYAREGEVLITKHPSAQSYFKTASPPQILSTAWAQLFSLISKVALEWKAISLDMIIYYLSGLVKANWAFRPNACFLN